MELTDDELTAVYFCVTSEVYYGDDEVVYGNGDYAVALRKGLAKLEDEIKGRNL